MQDILSNHKRWVKKTATKNIKVPLWTELSVARLWPEAHNLPQFAEHMPSDWDLAHPKRIERNFFMGILVYLAPEFLEHVILDIRSQRINQHAGR